MLREPDFSHYYEKIHQPDIESPATRLARVGGSFNPRERGGQEVQILLRHPLELLHA